jgi:hypothetical protein
MCLNTANDARMCIHCSAIVCAKCIEVYEYLFVLFSIIFFLQSWINQRNLCPKCS